MKASIEEDDFFGIEYMRNSPIPRHLLPASSKEKKKPSGIDFIESQYFGKLNGKDYDESQAEADDGASFIEQQYFAYTPSGPSVEKSETETDSPGNSTKLSEQTKFQAHHTQQMDRFSEQLLASHKSQHRMAPSFPSSSSDSDSAMNRNADEITAMESIMKLKEENNSLVENNENMDFFSQQLLSSYNTQQQSLHHIRNTSPDSRSVISEHRSSKLRQKGTEKRNTEDKERSSRIVISEPKVTLEDERSGLGKILDLIEPVWKMNNKQLVEMMCKRVIYEDDDLLAFDKPYQMAYSGAKPGQAQMDRILQDLKACIAPDVQRLCLVKSLDKSVTGVILFANESVQKEIVEKYKGGFVEQRYRAIVKGVPQESEATINIPLVKKSYKQDFIMRPIMPGSKVRPFIVTTDYRVIRSNGECSSLQCIVTNDIAHQIRSHLGLGLSCPIIGDAKYSGKKELQPPKLPASTVRHLQLAHNQYRRLPMYLHLSEVSIPLASPGSRTINIRAPLPAFFVHTLKKLRLMKV